MIQITHHLQRGGFPFPLNMLTGRSFASAEEEAKAMRIIKQMESWCADTHKHKAQMYAMEKIRLECIRDDDRVRAFSLNRQHGRQKEPQGCV